MYVKLLEILQNTEVDNRVKRVMKSLCRRDKAIGAIGNYAAYRYGRPNRTRSEAGGSPVTILYSGIL